MNEIIYFKTIASARGILKFIEAKKKSRDAFRRLGYWDKVLEKTKEIGIAAMQLWNLHGVEYIL